MVGDRERARRVRVMAGTRSRDAAGFDPAIVGIAATIWAAAQQSPSVTDRLMLSLPRSAHTEGMRRSGRICLTATAAVTASILAACTASGTSRPTKTQPSSASPTATESQPSSPSRSLAALHRALRLPTIRPGQPCPVTLSRHRPDHALGIVQGTGPAGPIGLTAHGVLQYLGPGQANALTDTSWGGAKVLWAVNSAVNGTVLVRGRELDGPRGLRFNDPAVSELVLAPKTPITPGGWRDYPSYTRLQAPGCYAYQVDASSGSTVIVFRAKGPKVAR